MIKYSVARIYSSNVLKDSYDIENDSNQYKVIYDGVMSKDDNVVRLRTLSKAPVILFIGTLSFEKGIKYACNILCEIHKTYPNTTLKLVGKYTEEAKSFVEGNYSEYISSGNIIYTPFTEKTTPLYCNSDFLLSLSKFEGFGRNVAEAMLRKLLVCGFSTGATPEVIGNRHCGILTDYGKDIYIANEIINIIEKPFLYEEMVSNAYMRARSKYTIEECAKDYLNFLSEL